MQNNNTRAKAAFMRFVAVLFITAVVGGCGADTSEIETRTRNQVEVLELKAGMSVGDMDVYSGTR